MLIKSSVSKITQSSDAVGSAFDIQLHPYIVVLYVQVSDYYILIAYRSATIVIK